MSSSLYGRWSRSALWILFEKRHILKLPDSLRIYMKQTPNFTFGDIASPLLTCYGESITREHIVDDDSLSKKYFHLAKAYNELTQLDFLLMKLIHGQNTDSLLALYRAELTPKLRPLRKLFSRYLTNRSLTLFEAIFVKLEKLEIDLKIIDRNFPHTAEFVEEFDALYDEILILRLIDEM